MKINKLLVLNILNEMACTCLNRQVDNKFYDFYFEKDMQWLLDNWQKIFNDFYSLDTTFERENGHLFHVKDFSKQDVKDIIMKEV